MTSRLPTLVALSSLLAFTACSSGEDSDTPDPSPTPASITYHQDVAPLLERACVGCHYEGGIAPFALDSYEKSVELADAIADSVRERRMPPWGVENSGDCGTYKDARWLDQQQIDTLVAWAGSSKAEGQPAAPQEQPLEQGLARVDAVLTMETEYTPDTSRHDDYRCFLVDPGLSEDAFMTAYFVRPGNAQVVHHVVLFEVGPNGTAEAEALDAADEGPGYTCFGAPNTSYASVVAAWAPGTPATIFPEDTGVKLTAGRKLVMQMHYNTLAGDGPDLSSMDLMLESRVDKQAFILLAGDYDLALKPAQADTRTMADIAMTDWGIPADLTIYAVFPHMHTLGTRMMGEIVSKDGSACMADIPRWDFNWQQFFFFQDPIRLKTDELLRITCHYTTASRDSMVPWGEGTEDEMCILGIYATLGPNDEAVSVIGQNRPTQPLPGDEMLGAPLPVQTVTSVGGTGYDQGRAMAAAPDGSYFAVGYTDSSTFTAGSARLTAPGGGDGFLVQYAPDGSVKWARLLGGTGRDGILDVQVDAAGGPVVCGYFGSTELVLGDEVLPLAGESDMFVARFASDGTLIASAGFGGVRSESCQGLAVLPDGGLALAVSFNAAFQAGDVWMETPSDVATGGVLRLDSDLSPVWAQVLTTADNTFVRRVAADDAGRIYGAGHIYGKANLGMLNIVSNGERDALAFALDPDGTPAWLRGFGDRSWDTARALAVSGSGEVAVGGLFLGTLRADATNLTFDGSEDGFILRLSSDGQVRSGIALGGEANAEVTSLAFTSAGGILATGIYEGELKLEDTYLTNAGSGDAFLVHLDADGLPLGAQHMGGLIGEWSAYLAATPAGGAVLVVNGNGDFRVDSENYAARSGGDAWILSLNPAESL